MNLKRPARYVSPAPQLRLLLRAMAGPLFLLPIAMHGRLCAQADVPQSHQAWSTDEGLPDASVHQVFQSRDGYLWLATEGGVARFDGSSFLILRHETQPAFISNDISSIAQDASGALWFGTADGLVESRSSTGTVLRRFGEADGLPSTVILSAAPVRDGPLLVLTSAGLVEFDGKIFRPVAGASAAIFALQPAPDGSVWLITSRGVERYQQGPGGPIVTHAVLPADAASDSANDTTLGVQSGPGGAVWTRTARSIFVSAPGFSRRLQVGVDLPATRLTTLYVDRQGTGWIGTNRGLFTLGPAPAAAIRAVDAMRLDSILSVMEDREGNMWIGTETSGVHALRPRKFRSELAAAGEAVTAGTTASDGSVWFGTRDNGVHRIGNGPVQQQPVPAAVLTSPVVLSLAAGSHGDIWAGTPDGLNHIDGKRVQQFASSSGLPDDFVRSLLVDAHGTVWAGTRRGLARVEGTTITTLTQRDGLGSDSIGPLLEGTSNITGRTPPTQSSTDLWVGTSFGLAHLHDGRVDNFLPHPNQASERAGNVITAIAQDTDGTMWVGVHGGGLTRFLNGRFIAVASSAIPAEVTSLVVDREGYLWLRGARGISRVSVAILRACADDATKCAFSVPTYGVADGMPSDALTSEGTPGVWQTADNELWFATRKGIAIADPANFPVNASAPPVVIERLLVDDTGVPLNAVSTRIAAGHSRYTFDYAALSFTLPAENRYRTMLEGFDSQWQDMGAARSASYTSLPPRKYRFRVQAQNNDGVWNEAGAEFRFEVLPPIYRRWWFYVLVLVLLGGAAVVVFRLRLNAAQRRFNLVLNERNRMAREIHDTLAQDFVSVSLQLDLAAQMLKVSNTEQAASQLQNTRELVRQGLDAARQSIWDLRANTSQDSLPARLNALAGRYVETGHPPLVKVTGAFRKLANALEDNVLRIAQEALANSYRHSAATEVSVLLHYDTGELRLLICDNGRGFSLEEAGRLEGHYGLRGMQERAASLSATLTIDSSPAAGTKLTLFVPLGEKD